MYYIGNLVVVAFARSDFLLAAAQVQVAATLEAAVKGAVVVTPKLNVRIKAASSLKMPVAVMTAAAVIMPVKLRRVPVWRTILVLL